MDGCEVVVIALAHSSLLSGVDLDLELSTICLHYAVQLYHPICSSKHVYTPSSLVVRQL